ncbi:MAG: hypothetical protein AAGM84_17715 [Pseudomonadota bacterium]
MSRLTDWDWADTEALRSRVARHDPGLEEAVAPRHEAKFGLPVPENFAERTETLDQLERLLLDCNPRGVLSLRLGPGPGLGEEANLAESFARALVPGVPDAVWRHLSGNYMFYNR